MATCYPIDKLRSPEDWKDPRKWLHGIVPRKDDTMVFDACAPQLACGHPKECWNHEDDQCAWCDEVHRLNADIVALRAQLEKQAIVVNSGEVTIPCQTLGYVRISGGKVMFPGTHSNSLDAPPIVRLLQ